MKEVNGKVTSRAVINLMKDIFAEQGVLKTVISDNGS